MVHKSGCWIGTQAYMTHRLRLGHYIIPARKPNFWFRIYTICLKYFIKKLETLSKNDQKDLNTFAFESFAISIHRVFKTKNDH